jgi:hypothetical protein
LHESLLWLLVAAQIYFPGTDSRRAVQVEFSDRQFIDGASGERGRTRLQMEIVRGGVNKVWIEEAGRV